jgi:TolB-like protein
MLLLGAALVALAGCGGPRTFVHPDVDISYYERIGVLPFRNLSGDRLAGEKITGALVTELLLKKGFEVVEPGQFRRSARETLTGNIDSGGEWKLDEIRRLGEQAGVQGIITGTVREFQMIRIGQTQYPLITIDVELIDVETGRVVWMISHTKKGGPTLPILSIGETHTLGELTQQVCREVVERISD